MNRIEIRLDDEEFIDIRILKSETKHYGFYDELWIDVNFCESGYIKPYLIKVRDDVSVIDFIRKVLKVAETGSIPPETFRAVALGGTYQEA